MPPIQVEDLTPGEVMQVTIAGDPMRADWSGAPCLYAEWAAGERRPEGWVSFQSAATPVQTLTVRTPKGVLKLPPNRLRLHLAPSFTRTWQPGDRHGLPDWYAPEPGEATTVEEFRLEADRHYFARAEVESYWLPPGPDGRPERGHNTVLALSDAPWREGQPAHPLTPRGQQHTY